MIIDIFKTSIYKTSLQNQEYINYFIDLLNKERKLNNSNYVSNIGGFQSKSLNTIDDNIKENLFIKPTLEYIKQFNKDYKIELVEDYSCNNKQQLSRKEGEYQKANECVKQGYIYEIWIYDYKKNKNILTSFSNITY